jgi:hypothetical protein
MITVIRDFVARKNDVPAEELKDWEDEFGRSNEADKYFSAATDTFSRRQNPALEARRRPVCSPPRTERPTGRC